VESIFGGGLESGHFYSCASAVQHYIQHIKRRLAIMMMIVADKDLAKCFLVGSHLLVKFGLLQYHNAL
jgi:hypothetical protein